MLRLPGYFKDGEVDMRKVLEPVGALRRLWDECEATLQQSVTSGVSCRNDDKMEFAPEREWSVCVLFRFVRSNVAVGLRVEPGHTQTANILQ